MSATAVNYMEMIERMPPDSRLFLRDVSWEDYEQLLAELEEKPRVRISFDRGSMEVMTLSFRHEKWKSLFGHLLAILTEELDLSFIGAGPVTLRRDDAQKGKEPDDCYYIQHALEMQGKDEINLAVDPAPDLAVEIDVSSPTLNKLPIYADLGVPEVWIFDGQETTFYQLRDGAYVEAAASVVFPFLTATDLTNFLHLGHSGEITSMRRAFREWVQAHKG
ncbi:MAG: Uma2 family endonuclease [Blastocatellia bacterium]